MTRIGSRGEWLTPGIGSHWHDQSLETALSRFCQSNGISSAIDLGCGLGQYAKRLAADGVHCDAFDGNPLTASLTDGFAKVADLSERFDAGRTYDAVISLEVGEHIPAEYEAVFLDNVCRHASQWVVLSWAVVGQAGDGHVNCRNNDYVISKMLEAGFALVEDATLRLREESSLRWFKNTLMVFRRQS